MMKNELTNPASTPAGRRRTCRAEAASAKAEAARGEAKSNPTQSESHRVAASHSDFKKDTTLIPAAPDRTFPLIPAYPAGSDNTMKHENCVLAVFPKFQPEQPARQRVPTEMRPRPFVLFQVNSR